MAGAYTDGREGLFSKAVKQMRVAIQLLESKKELMVYTRDEHASAHFSLMTFEYERKNFKAAIDCYNLVMGGSKHKTCSPQFRGTFYLYYQLLMLRLYGKECKLSDFAHYISREGNRITNVICMEAIVAFRARKQFDYAIGIEKACGSMIWSPLESKLSLALTYLEQYRLDFHRRPQLRSTDFAIMNSLIMSLQVEYPIEYYTRFEYCLVLAQWYYLTHNLIGNKETKKRMIDATPEMVEAILRSGSPLPQHSKLSEDSCYTCGQAATSTEVQFVCSGCRVACYCSIDHQRMTWKNEAWKGICVGHEVLCPLYKAHRKYKEATKSRDKEKESRMKRRFDRECVRFLEDGLGLKDKCFPCEYQSML